MSRWTPAEYRRARRLASRVWRGSMTYYRAMRVLHGALPRVGGEAPHTLEACRQKIKKLVNAYKAIARGCVQ